MQKLLQFLLVTQYCWLNQITKDEREIKYRENFCYKPEGSMHIYVYVCK
jgi:hypothetical protein